jgi:phenylacetic acid degradation operon negative regulatory protein
MLLTVLGEYVLPRRDRGGIWQEALVAALGAIGYTTHAARQALARSTRDGWLTTERHGRRARMTLTDETAQLLSEGTKRIYSFGQPSDWDGHWLLVVVRVPESRRDVRHHLRSRLAWAGLGSLGGGLWLTPHVAHEREVQEAVADESVAEVISFRAEVGALGNPQRVVRAAWDLDAVAELYRAFVADFSRLRPADGEAAFRAQSTMVHAWRKFPFIDPDLPASLLPSRWPKGRAHELFHDRHERWGPAAVAYFESLVAA